MTIDQQNKIVLLCTQGMQKEGEGKPAEAKELFAKAWENAQTDFEKYIAAHYLARQQDSLTQKLFWDQQALHYALQDATENSKEALSSLYLNIGKCQEDLEQYERAANNYQLAQTFAGYLANDGYGNMMRSGIEAALKRMEMAEQKRRSAQQA